MKYAYGDQTYDVSLEPLPDGTYRAIVGDRVYVVGASSLDRGSWLLTLDGAQTVIYTASRGDERYVAIGGEVYTLAVPQTRRHSSAASSGDLTAQMPGQVQGVLVTAGDTVERGQTLLLLEAMKMEIRVTAPADGKVKRVLVQPGDVVDRGQRLLEIE